MLALLASLVTIGILGLFHVFSAEVTSWSFTIWSIAMVAYSLYSESDSLPCLEWFANLLRNAIEGLRFLGGSMNTILAITAILAGVLEYFHILPDIGISLFIIGGMATGIIVGNHRKALARIEPDPLPPVGLGGYVPPAVVERKSGGQSNSALLVLMKSIESEIEARSPKELSEKTDEIYEEPMASYPMEMEQEL
jgi:hypothetical protein